MSPPPSSSHDFAWKHHVSESSSTASTKSSTSTLPHRVSWRRPTIDATPEPQRQQTPESPSRAWNTNTEKSLENGQGHQESSRLVFRERIRHFTWTWFTMTMATGGIANVLYSIPTNFRFPHLYALGCIFFLLNIALFLFNITMISCRFYLYPSTFKASFLHPTESLFIPAAVISFGTILINISQYGVGENTGEWLEETMIVLYWFYCGLAILFSSGIYLIMWSTQTFTISQMTPVWIFPAYPLLIVGPHAGNLAKKLSPEAAFEVILGGYILQGIGFMVSLMIYSAFLYRLMTQKLPKESLRPGMFISVGPSGFTISGLINMGQQLPRVVSADFMGRGMGEFAGRVSMIAANWAGIWLWGLAIWFFLVSVGAHFSCAARGKMDFAMTWYSFIFPNTALTTATFAVSTALHGDLTNVKGSMRPFQILGCCMAVGLIVMWFFVFSMMVRAVLLRQILWPQMQEDRDEGGWGRDEVVRKGEIRSVVHSRQSSGLQVPTLRTFGTTAEAATTGMAGSQSGGSQGLAEGIDAILARQMRGARDGGWRDVARRGQERDRERGWASGTPTQLGGEPEHDTIGGTEKV